MVIFSGPEFGKVRLAFHEEEILTKQDFVVQLLEILKV